MAAALARGRGTATTRRRAASWFFSVQWSISEPEASAKEFLRGRFRFGYKCGNNNSRVFEVAAGVNATLKDLTLTGGNGMANNPSGSSDYVGDGGGVLNLGTLTV